METHNSGHVRTTACKIECTQTAKTKADGSDACDVDLFYITHGMQSCSQTLLQFEPVLKERLHECRVFLVVFALNTFAIVVECNAHVAQRGKLVGFVSLKFAATRPCMADHYCRQFLLLLGRQ